MTNENLIHQLRNSKGWPTLGNAAADRIEALIAEQAAIKAENERVRAEAYLSGWVNGSNGIEPPDFGNPVFEKGEHQ